MTEAWFNWIQRLCAVKHHLFDTLLYGKITLFKFQENYSNWPYANEHITPAFQICSTIFYKKKQLSQKGTSILCKVFTIHAFDLSMHIFFDRLWQVNLFGGVRIFSNFYSTYSDIKAHTASLMVHGWLVILEGSLCFQWIFYKLDDWISVCYFIVVRHEGDIFIVFHFSMYLNNEWFEPAHEIMVLIT